jgi:4-oxalocrotonate tautomerase
VPAGGYGLLNPAKAVMMVCFKHGMKGQCMPVVTIQQSPGRTKEQKQLLIKRITEAFEEAYGMPPEGVTVFFQNFDDEHWGKGGYLHADRDVT